MSTIMTMPKLGVNMTRAVITEWAVKEGDFVKEGDHLLDAETDKAIQEIPATVSGYLARVLVQPGEKVACQDPLAEFTDSADAWAEAVTTSVSENELNGRVRVSPLAKRIATELGLDYTKIPPARPGLRITKADVLAYSRKSGETATVAPAATPRSASPPAPSAVSAPSEVEVIPLSGTREVIAERMSESVRTMARAILTMRVDAEALIRWRGRLKEDGHGVSYNELMIPVLAKALGEFPIMNARFAGSEIHCPRQVNIGTAVDTERGLVVPVVKDAGNKGVLAIHEEFRAMLERARMGRNNPDDLSDGTFTITNLGMCEIDTFIPIIKPPECAILGVGAMVREPVVVDDKDTVQVRSRMALTLAFDHRIVDGAPAARFLQRVKTLLEWPMGMLS
jgi:pyruvate dehydrogenase E2 component (dihydrolipoamide acetyltransferase)